VSIEYYSKLEHVVGSPAPPPPSSTRSHAPCSSTTPNRLPAAATSATAGALTTFDTTAPAPSTSITTEVGDLELAYESVDMISESGLTLTFYAAEPGSTTEHALALLASWAATPDVGVAAQPT
jgi:hypothetical protein